MATRKTSKTSTKINKEEEVKSEETSSKKPSQGYRLKVKKTHIIILLIIIGIGLFIFFFRGLFLVATVNGEPITRLSVIQELERQHGKQTMDSLVTKTLILQQAKKENVKVSDKEIDDQIKEIEDNLKQQGQTLDQALQTSGMTRNQLEEQLEIEQLIQKMVAKDVKVTDKEVNDYITANKANLPQGLSETDLKTSVKQQLQQQKTGQKFQTWLEDLKKKAKINNFVNF